VVLVATQGQGDEEALEAALRSPAKQVLLIASRRKAEKLRAVMRMRGIDESQFARLQAPAGPDAGAKTPGEIALVAIVGVLALWRGRGPSPVNIGHVREEAAEDAGQAGRQLDARTAPGTTAEGKFINPVCGMAVSTANPMHIEKYEDVTYYFCCDGCRTTFQNDPAKYAAIHRASLGSVPA
jgi:xanthine dehydrogenase accessory factor